MYRSFELCLNVYADDEISIDYWSDVAIISASEMLERFSDGDWLELLSSIDCKGEFWALRLCEVLGDFADERALSVLLKVISRDSEMLRCAALESIRSMIKLGLYVSKYSDDIKVIVENAKKTKASAGSVSMRGLERIVFYK